MNCMKNISASISNESYKVLTDYKLDKNLNKLEEALDSILEEYKEMKGGKK